MISFEPKVTAQLVEGGSTAQGLAAMLEMHRSAPSNALVPHPPIM